MANRYLGGERPAPRSETESPLGNGWADTLERFVEAIEGCLLHEALREILEFVDGANKVVDAEQPWTLAKAWKGGDEAAGERLRAVLGDLVEACRLIGLAAAPFLPTTAPRVLEQLGHAYAYEADGNGGPPILDELRWGIHATEAGTLTEAKPLFPRLDVETAAS
jgi:methionyl-tRNA synthetase